MSNELDDLDFHGRNSDRYQAAFWTLIIILAIGGLIWFWQAHSSPDKNEPIQSAQNGYDRQTAQYTPPPPPTNAELYPPNSFLQISSSGYVDLLWAFRMSGTIHNNAPITYKDAVIGINFYSKTGSEIGYQSYTIYKFFAPQTTVDFEIKEQDKALRHADHIQYRIENATIVND